MKYKSEIITSASGSIGGSSYQSGRGGLIRFARPRNTNANSPRQRAVRSLFSSLAITWRDVLSESQRAAWSSYAVLSPTNGKLGDPLTLTGSQMFLRCNTIRRQAGLSLVLDGPTTPGLVQLGNIPVLAVVGNPFIGWLIPVSDPWAQETGGGLIIQTSRFIAKANNSQTAHLRFLASILGLPGGPGALFTSIANAYQQVLATAEVGQRFFLRYTSFRADGRISSVRDDVTRLT